MGGGYSIIKDGNTLKYSYDSTQQSTEDLTKVYQYYFKNVMNDNMAVKMHELTCDGLAFEYATSNTEQTDTTSLTFGDKLLVEPLAPKGQSGSEIYVYVKVTATADNVAFSCPIKWTFGYAQTITCYANGQPLGDPILGICNAGITNPVDIQQLTPEVEEGYEVTWYKDEACTIPAEFPLKENASANLHARVPNLPSDWLTPTDGGYMVVKGSTPLDAGKLVVPATYNGQPVISIADGDMNAGLQGDYSSAVFFAQTQLTDIDLPNTMQYIGFGAFIYCTGLTNVTLPDSVQVINVGAFAMCLGLQTIKLPKNLTALLPLTFSDCPNLTYVDASYTNITTITGEAMGMKLGAPFYQNQYAPGLQRINLTGCNQLQSIGYAAFAYCDSLSSVTIPEGVTSIGEWAFEKCTSLSSITIPDSVTSIGDWAFYDCSGLTSVDFGDNSQLTSIGNNAFSYCDGLTSISIPASVTSIGDWAFYNCIGLTSVTFGANSQLTSIGNYAFYDCIGLTSVEFGANSQLQSIGDYAFYECSVLTSISIPASVTSIGNHAFYYCNGLTSVHFGANSQLQSIGDWAFNNCSVLTSIEFG
ncbi:MAG: leucine-rich repeat protein, partial [Clostridia bacterium]|nr:leucine-rich repeat protein [Clostridia bacterium]